MKLVNGLRTAERIRQMDEKVSIIFLTTLTQCALEGYKYQAANYIIKHKSGRLIFTLFPLVCCTPVSIVIALVIPYLCFKNLEQHSIVERLRAVD